MLGPVLSAFQILNWLQPQQQSCEESAVGSVNQWCPLLVVVVVLLMTVNNADYQEVHVWSAREAQRGPTC